MTTGTFATLANCFSPYLYFTSFAWRAHAVRPYGFLDISRIFLGGLP